jgi:phospholipid transport system substrate-binding protein
MRTPSLASGLLALLLTGGVPALAQAQDAAAPAATQAPLSDPAAKQVKVFYDALLTAMKNAKSLGVTGRYKTLEPAIDATFDFSTMTKMAVGPQWDTTSEADRKALSAAFRRMTIADYAHNFDGYGGEQFIIDPAVKERSGDKIVSSKMILPGKDPVPFVYRMDKASGSWRVIDIFLNGYVSEVATRRADFASTLKDGGASALAQKLNAMTDKTLKGG